MDTTPGGRTRMMSGKSGPPNIKSQLSSSFRPRLFTGKFVPASTNL